MKYLWLMLLATAALAQTLPDAPQPQPPQPAAHHICWHCPWKVDTRSNHDVLHDWKFRTFGGALVVSTIFDIEVTHEGLAHHWCTEANEFGRGHPSRGELYLGNAIADGAVLGMGFVMKKARIPWVAEGMFTYGTVRHVKGGMSWFGRCW